MIKPSYPPLFIAGFHDLSDDELREKCVTDFPASERRDMLYCNLIQLMSFFRLINQTYRIVEEVWVDGSFTTSKMEPDDVDILIVFDFQALNGLPVQMQPQVQAMLNRQYVKQNFNIDLLLLVKNHPDVDYDYDEKRSYWRGWFGFDRQESAKGLVRIAL